jgi:ribosomal protein S6
MADLVKQNYELAYHVNPDLDDTEIQKTRQDLENLITSNNGVVSFSRDPEKTRLSYVVDKHNNSYFGYFLFDLDSGEAIENIKNTVGSNSNVFRFIVLKYDTEKKDKKSIVRKMALEEKKKAKVAKQRVKDEIAKSKDIPIKEGEIDKKLEEILDKI